MQVDLEFKINKIRELIRNNDRVIDRLKREIDQDYDDESLSDIEFDRKLELLDVCRGKSKGMNKIISILTEE